MSDADLKQRWAIAKAAVDELEEKRLKLLEPLEQEYLSALTSLEAVDAEVDNSECFRCEACRTPIFLGDRYHAGVTPLCLECAPTYQSLIDDAETFVNMDDESPADPDALRARFDEHIANGGSADDKLVDVYE